MIPAFGTVCLPVPMQPEHHLGLHLLQLPCDSGECLSEAVEEGSVEVTREVELLCAAHLKEDNVVQE